MVHVRLRLPRANEEPVSGSAEKTDNAGAMFISCCVPTALQVPALTSGINLFQSNALVKAVCSMKGNNYTSTFCCYAQIYPRGTEFMTSKFH